VFDPFVTEPDVEAAVLAALRPSGVRERVRLAMGGGYTALQVWERVGPAARAALAPVGEDPTVAARHAVERVQRVLMTLAASGRVRHRRVGMSVVLNTKGPRDVLVDVFRAT
jgi:hypothetical protein